jgi:hypothetical protein
LLLLVLFFSQNHDSSPLSENSFLLVQLYIEKRREIQEIKAGIIITGPKWPEPVEIKRVGYNGDYIHIVGATALSNNHIDQLIPSEELSDISIRTINTDFKSEAWKVFHIKFVKVNVDQEQEISSRYGIRGIPVIKFFCEGKEVGEIVGYISKDVLNNEIKRVSNNAQSCLANTSLVK